MSWLEQVAPTIATALGGPLAGLAVGAVSKVLGIGDEETKQLLETGKMTAEQIAQVKIAEIELQKQAQALGLNFEQLAVDDRKSARAMQIETKSAMPGILSCAITIGFFGILIAVMRDPAVATNQPLLIMLGSLGTAWIAVVNYWFGTTNGSQRKDQMLFNSAPMEAK